MLRFDPTLYLITDRRFCENRNLVDLVEEAVTGGVTLVQLREKEMPYPEMTALAKELVKRLKPFGVSLIINDFPDVAIAAGAGGVHLGRDDVHPKKARAILGPNAIIGISADSTTDIPFSWEDVNYIAASPVFPTPTKKNTSQPWLPSGLARLRTHCQIPLIAIGGITLKNIPDVLKAGADGVAIVSAILTAKDVKAAAIQLKNEILNFRKEKNAAALSF